MKMKKNNLLSEYNISRIINYLRRSRQDVQREKLTGEDTLTAQRKLMTGILDNYGIPYDQRNEIGSGDKISTRPVFVQVLEDLKLGKYQAIAVKEISRLGRGSFKDSGIIYDLITDKKIFIITPTRIYDPSNTSDIRQIRFEMFFAREEFETTRERLTGARYNSALEGKWMGQIPFGYSRSKSTMRLIPKEDEAKIVQLIFSLYINGYEGKQVREKAIGTILKRLGIKTAKNKNYWDTTQLKRILTNDVYIGVSKFRQTKRNSEGKIEKRDIEEHIIVEGAHTPIIEKENFEKVQELMKGINRPRTRFDVDSYELTGLLTCKNCGKKAVVNRYKRKRLNGEYYDIYLKCKNGCFTVKYNFVEDNIVNLLTHLKEIDENEVAEIYQKSIEKKDEQELEAIKENIFQAATQKKEDLKKRLRFIADKHFDGVYTDEDYLSHKKEIDQELKELENMLNGNLETAATTEKINGEEIHNKLIKIFDIYKGSDNAIIKNELLRNLFEELTIDVIEKGTKKHAPKIKFEITLAYDFWEKI